MRDSMHLQNCSTGKTACYANGLANSFPFFPSRHSHHRSQRLSIRPGSLSNDENGGRGEINHVRAQIAPESSKISDVGRA